MERPIPGQITSVITKLPPILPWPLIPPTAFKQVSMSSGIPSQGGFLFPLQPLSHWNRQVRNALQHRGWEEARGTVRGSFWSPSTLQWSQKLQNEIHSLSCPNLQKSAQSMSLVISEMWWDLTNIQLRPIFRITAKRNAVPLFERKLTTHPSDHCCTAKTWSEADSPKPTNLSELHILLLSCEKKANKQKIQKAAYKRQISHNFKHSFKQLHFRHFQHCLNTFLKSGWEKTGPFQKPQLPISHVSYKTIDQTS